LSHTPGPAKSVDVGDERESTLFWAISQRARTSSSDPQLRSPWQARFSHLCVDEFQDVDAARLRLIRVLGAPENNLFVVGDDDQPYFGIRTYRPAVPLDYARRVIYGPTASRPTAEP
jgi:superfamily I DNA/RNA helicase